MTWIAPTLMAAAIACAPLPVHADPPPKVRLDVDTSALPESSATNAFARWLAQDQTHTILDGGLEVAPDAPTGIRIVVTRYGEDDINYQARVALIDAESGAVHEERVVTCELCTDGQLITKVSPEVARLAARVLYAPVEVVVEPPQASEETQEREPPQASEETQEREPPPAPEAVSDPTLGVQPPIKSIGILGAWGIASAAVGVGATGAGIGLALAPDRVRPAQGNAEQRSTRPAGLALVGVGTVLMVAGAVLVALDVTRKQRARRVSVFPELTGSTASIVFSTRF